MNFRKMVFKKISLLVFRKVVKKCKKGDSLKNPEMRGNDENFSPMIILSSNACILPILILENIFKKFCHSIFENFQIFK